MQEELQKLPPGFPRGVIPQPPFPQLAPTMAQMHTLMPTQSLQPTQQLEYKVPSPGLHRIVFVLCAGTIMIYFPCATADAAGAIAAAAAYPAAAQRHGAPGPKSFRWRGQHPAARSAPEEAPRAFATRHQPGEGLDLFTLCACLPVCPRCFDQ